MKLKVHYLISGHHANEHLEIPKEQHRQALVFILKKCPGVSPKDSVWEVLDKGFYLEGAPE